MQKRENHILTWHSLSPNHQIIFSRLYRRCLCTIFGFRQKAPCLYLTQLYHREARGVAAAWMGHRTRALGLAMLQLIQGNGRKLVKWVLACRTRKTIYATARDMSLQAIGSVLIGAAFARALCVISYREISSPKKSCTSRKSCWHCEHFLSTAV